MAKLSVKPASTDVTLLLFIQDTSSTSGAGLTGLTYNSSGLVCYYARARAAAVQIPLVTQTVTGAHADGGFVEIDATNMPGWYRLDLPDAVVDAGVRSVGVHLKGATSMAPLPLEIDLGTELGPAGFDAIIVEAGINARQALSITTAGAGGVLTGANGTTVAIAAAGIPATNRITATVDEYGNRSSVTLNLPT
jgi:hypothetical protein